MSIVVNIIPRGTHTKPLFFLENIIELYKYVESENRPSLCGFAARRKFLKRNYMIFKSLKQFRTTWATRFQTAITAQKSNFEGQKLHLLNRRTWDELFNPVRISIISIIVIGKECSLIIL